MSGFNLNVNLNIDKALRRLSAVSREVEPAAVATVNKTLTTIQSNTRRRVAKAFRVPTKSIRFRITLPRKYMASRGRVSGNVAGWFEPLKASKFGKPRQEKYGATVRGASGGRRKFDGAFVGRMPSGHVGVYKRRGKSRLPIEEQKVPLMPQAGNIARAVFAEKTADMNRLFTHELKRRARL